MALSGWRSVKNPQLGIQSAALAALLLLLTALALGFSTEVGTRPIEVYYAGVAASLLALLWPLWVLFKPSDALPKRWKAALILITIGNACMLGSMIGMLALGLQRTTPLIDNIIQSGGIVTYIAWAAALFALPAKRMLDKTRLPWILDVALIVTAISAAGWFFLIAPQVSFAGTRFAIWLTLAFPLANLISIASVVAAMSLGGPFRSARGLLMLGITINVAGDVIQSIYLMNRIVVPSGPIHCLWVACTLVVGLGALQLHRDAQNPIVPVVRTSRASFGSAVIPILFLAGLVLLALWGNSARPNSNDVIGLNFGCMVAIICCLGRILCLIKDNADLADSLTAANENLDAQVTERTQQLSEAMDDLERQKLFLRSVIDALPSFVVSQSGDGTVLLANQSAARLYGRKLSELEGAGYAEIAGAANPSAPAIIAQETQSLLIGGLTLSAEREIVGADGQPRMFEVVKTPVRGGNDVPDQVLIVGNDITVRKEAEKALISARDAAEQATQVKSEFLANMSHELRTPLNGVIGLTELLLAESLPYAQRELALNIRNSGEDLLGIVNNVLDMAKLDSGQAVIETAPVSLAGLCSDVIDRYRSIAASKKLSLRCDVHLDPGAKFLTDGQRVKQILGHLLSNAIKFTPTGTVSVDVDLVRQSRDIAKVRFAVRDTGIGIPADQLQSIFEPFSQVDASMSRGYGGAGLGLSLCTQFVKMLGGTIQVESSPEGSLFTVDLPLKLAVGEEQALPALGRSLAGLKVLVVEDNHVNQIILKKLLERQGCSVDLAGNGQEAIAWLAKERCDLVLMDCQMPIMDGLEATRQIRSSEAAAKQVPIIAVTANAMPGDREKCLAAGMDDYVPKPIRIEALTNALARLTKLSSAA
ncbi:MAG: response regulator [Fimbriimonas sp.]